jgi:hypothetical protein
LRAGRWFDHYNRSAEFAHMMRRWCDAILRDPSFRQQLDPVTGEFTQSGSASYSPAALVLYDYTWRLAGVRRCDDELHWNIHPDCPAAQNGTFRTHVDRGGAVAELRYLPHSAELSLNGKPIAQLEGGARLITGLDGAPHAIVGLLTTVTTVKVRLHGQESRHITLDPNQRKSLS